MELIVVATEETKAGLTEYLEVRDGLASVGVLALTIGCTDRPLIRCEWYKQSVPQSTPLKTYEKKLLGSAKGSVAEYKTEVLKDGKPIGVAFLEVTTDPDPSGYGFRISWVGF